MRTPLVLLVTALAAGLAIPVQRGETQAAPTPDFQADSGARIRVQSPLLRRSTAFGEWLVGTGESSPRRGRVVGTYAGLVLDTLLFNVPIAAGQHRVELTATHRVPLGSIERLEMSAGRDRAGSAVLGALSGALAVAAIHFLLGGLVVDLGGEGNDFPWDQLAVAAGVGAGLGVAFPQEKWQRVTVPHPQQ